jgi:hypothetical protein
MQFLRESHRLRYQKYKRLPVLARWRDKIAQGELSDLVEYLFSLTPKDQKADF